MSLYLFEAKINTPSVLIDLFAALEATTTGNMVRVNLNAQLTARKSFTEIESSKKIQSALTYANEGFKGDIVYYGRQNCKGCIVLRKYMRNCAQFKNMLGFRS